MDLKQGVGVEEVVNYIAFESKAKAVMALGSYENIINGLVVVINTSKVVVVS